MIGSQPYMLAQEKYYAQNPEHDQYPTILSSYKDDPFNPLSRLVVAIGADYRVFELVLRFVDVSTVVWAKPQWGGMF